ncbi:glycosyltransferase family 2 protein [Sulfuricaulis sp.]|jgi:glycosyltransferase involved in cell wall biosynthesis|uniref:glycosyltransferase family 2 protein n=1 Tax=Sulfuricaulis sp. TaxID=2003553 RepID=UPI00355A5ADF
MTNQKQSQPIAHTHINNQDLPLASIGVPVYNEERFIRESLQSLSLLDYTNLEIIISDNASTDRTGEICREFASKDARISYFRFEQNRGVTENFRRVFDLSHGKYFMWASGHDLWMPNIVSKCVEMLEEMPAAVIAYGSSNWMNAAGSTLDRETGWVDTRDMSAVARFFSVFWGNMHPILGVIRSEALRKARLLSIAGTDLITLSDLALMGDFVHNRDTSWARREFRKDETFKQRMSRYRNREYALSRSLIDKMFPIFRLPIELIAVVIRSHIPWSEKIGIIGILLPSMPVKYFVARRMANRGQGQS